MLRFQRYQGRSFQYLIGGSGYGEDHSNQVLNRNCSLDCDQTAALITFAVTMLADNPRIFARLRNEVLATLGPYGKVTPESVKAMKYLRAVLNGE
jgi:hypothetical protein